MQVRREKVLKEYKESLNKGYEVWIRPHTTFKALSNQVRGAVNLAKSLGIVPQDTNPEDYLK